MPKKKIEIIDVEIRLDLEKEIESLTANDLPVEAKIRIDEIINEQNVIAIGLSKKRQELKKNEDNLQKVFDILYDSFNRSIEHKCQPEPISAEKLIELYGSSVILSALVARLKSFIKRNYNNKYVLMRVTKNKKAAYILVQYA